MKIPIEQVQRSLELYNLQTALKEASGQGDLRLEITKEPIRTRDAIKKIVVAFGSYDPLTIGHEQFFHTGMETAQTCAPIGPLELLVVTSTSHFEKQVDLSKNSTIYDRVHALESFAKEDTSIAMFNSPYLIHLAPAIHQAYTNAKLFFLVGADVMEKIVYRPAYEKVGTDMEPIVDELLKHTFLVSKRHVTYKDREARTLDLPTIITENPILEKYTANLLPIEVKRTPENMGMPFSEISSTLVRKMCSENKDATALMATDISAFVQQRRLYLENSNEYADFVGVRQEAADSHKSEPISSYIHKLMETLKHKETTRNI